MSDPKIGVIGPGSVGAALGNRLVEAGYAVSFGVRDDDAADKAKQRVHPEANIRSTTDAAASADVVFLAVPGSAAVDAASSLGSLDGKILVDCSNALRWDAGPVWSPPDAGSVSEAIATRCPGARVVKGFNTFGAEFHGNPDVDGVPADVFLASDDQAAKDTVGEIATRAGFHPVDAGPLRNARLLENLAILWIHLATVGQRGRTFTFALRNRPPGDE